MAINWGAVSENILILIGCFILLLGAHVATEHDKKASARQTTSSKVRNRRKKGASQRSQLDPLNPFSMINVADSIGIDGGIDDAMQGKLNNTGPGSFGKFP